jgi:hypothetical protein
MVTTKLPVKNHICVGVCVPQMARNTSETGKSKGLGDGKFENTWLEWKEKKLQSILMQNNLVAKILNKKKNCFPK